MPKQMLKSIFLVRAENLYNPEKFVFPDCLGFPVPAEKKWITDLESTPQKTFI